MKIPEIFTSIIDAISASKVRRESVLFKDPLMGDDKVHSLEHNEAGEIEIPGIQPGGGSVFSTGQGKEGPQKIIKGK